MAYFKWSGFSLVDAPSSAAVIYTKGCNLRCPYCYNLDLLNTEEQLDDLTEEEVFSYIDRIQKINKNTNAKYNSVDWLIISGGEPFVTNINIIESFLRKAKDLNLKTGINTNGYFPEFIERLTLPGHSKLNSIRLDYKNLENDKFKNSFIHSLYNYLGKPSDRYFIVNTTLLKSIHTLDYLKRMKEYMFILCKMTDSKFDIIKSKDLKQQHFVWVLTPFYNNYNKIRTLGNLDFAETYSEEELDSIIASL